LVLALIALLAVIDDLLEVIAGVVDVFHLDAFHGVAAIAFLSLSKAINETINEIVEAKESIKRAEEELFATENSHLHAPSAQK